MADPIIICKTASTVVNLSKSEKVRTVVGTVVVTILLPFVLIIVCIMGALSGMTEHNHAAVDYVFDITNISDNVPTEYKAKLDKMKLDLGKIEDISETLSSELDESSLDITRIKATFYAVFFENGTDLFEDFVRCFITTELRGQGENAYTVTIPQRDMSKVYFEIQNTFSLQIQEEHRVNASEIYHRVLYGGEAPTSEAELDTWLSTIIQNSNNEYVGESTFAAPIDADWRSKVTSEFGSRTDPFTKEVSNHSGIDIGVQKGAPIKAALSGTVSVVRYGSTGYGYYVVIDHGGGVVTLYAHCSKILVEEGQSVSQGDAIAEVGSTGRSTGNHLHFEVRINGEKINPREVLN